MLRSISLHARHHTCPVIHHSIEHIFVCLSRVSSRPGTQRPSHSVRCARLKVLWCTLQCPAVPCCQRCSFCTVLYSVVHAPAAHALRSTRYPLDHTILLLPMLSHAAHALHPHDHAALSARTFPSGPRFPLLTMLSMLSMLSFVVHAAARSCSPRCPCLSLWAL